MKLVIVTASAAKSWNDLSQKQRQCVISWHRRALYQWPVVHVFGARGVVPAFREGIERAASQHTDASVVLLLHDDVEIFANGWDQMLLEFYQWAERFKLGVCVGFSGALGIGRRDIYKADYDPMQLARQQFISNLQSAEAHGARVDEPRRVACFDGFSFSGPPRFVQKAFRELDDVHGIVHHAYDTMLGVMAWENGLESWFLPVDCEHYGGMTTVGSEAYQKWAQEQHGSDAQVWQHAHRAFYEYGKGKLPLHIGEIDGLLHTPDGVTKVRGIYRPRNMQFY